MYPFIILLEIYNGVLNDILLLNIVLFNTYKDDFNDKLLNIFPYLLLLDIFNIELIDTKSFNIL